MHTIARAYLRIRRKWPDIKPAQAWNTRHQGNPRQGGREHDVNTISKSLIVVMLDRWIRQRPGLKFGNYGERAAYTSEMRSITKDGNIAKKLLRYVEGRDSITAEKMLEGFNSYSGRLKLEQRENGKWVLDYCTGQYWPTEYRKAAASVLASIIWNWMRDDCMPSESELAKRKQSPGDYLRQQAWREFGRGIAGRYFN